MISNIYNLSYGVKVTVVDGAGSIEPGELKALDDPSEDPEMLCLQAAYDAIISIVLAHACAGIDVSSKAYNEGFGIAVASATYDWV